MTTPTWTLDTTIGNTENPGVQDTGNGALATYEVSRDYPGIRRVTVRSYCGRRSDDRRYYSLIATSAQHATLAAAKRAAKI